MANEEYPVMNEVAVSWAEVIATVNLPGGATITGIDWKGFTWESKVERGWQRGPGGRKKKKTSGQVDNTATASLYRSGMTKLKEGLEAVAPKDAAGVAMLSQVGFNLMIQFSVPGDPKITTIKIQGCNLDKDAGKTDDGSTDVDVVEIDLTPTRIVEMINGKETVLK